MEKPDSEIKKRAIEEEVNLEINDTELLLERLNNPKIRERVVDLLLNFENTRPPRMVIVRNKKGDIIFSAEVDKNRKKMTREEAEALLEKRIEIISSMTTISYDKQG